MKKASVHFRALIESMLLLAMLVSLAFAQSQPAQQPEQQKQEQDQGPTVRVGITLVTVPVIVTDGFGRFISGLKERDFTVRENGVEQKIDKFSDTAVPFNVALLIDSSRSTNRKLPVIRKAALTFIEKLLPNDRVMVVSFDDKIRFLTGLTSDHKTLKKAIDSVESGYSTRLYDAIQETVLDKLSAVQGRKAIVVLTDGVDRGSKFATYDSALQVVARNGIISYAIQYETRNDGAPLMKPMLLPGNNFVSGSSPVTWQEVAARKEQEQQEKQQQEPPKEKSIINIPRPNSPGGSTQPPDPQRPSRQVIYVNKNPARDSYLVAADFLKALAYQSGARYLPAESIENTSFYFDMIAAELRNQYTLTYYTSNEARDGSYRTISVSVGNNRNYVARTRQGYYAPKAEPEEKKNDEK